MSDKRPCVDSEEMEKAVFQDMTATDGVLMISSFSVENEL